MENQTKGYDSKHSKNDHRPSYRRIEGTTTISSPDSGGNHRRSYFLGTTLPNGGDNSQGDSSARMSLPSRQGRGDNSNRGRTCSEANGSKLKRSYLHCRMKKRMTSPRRSPPKKVIPPRCHFQTTSWRRNYPLISVHHILANNDTMDPKEHLDRFENSILIYQYLKGGKCRVFLTTLIGPV